MKQITFLFLLLLGLQPQSGYAQIKQQNLLKTVTVLTADSLAGRKAGTGYDLKTARYLEKQLTDMGYQPLYGNSGIVEFKYRTRRNADSTVSYNIAMILRSPRAGVTDYFLIGAHHDHLGTTEKEGETLIYRGANDNASGVASLLEIARNLSKKRNQLNRHLLIAAFGAEEIGLIGSHSLGRQLQKDSVPLQFMLNLEMTGCLNAQRDVEVLGKEAFDLENSLKAVKNPDKLNFILLNTKDRVSDQVCFMQLCPTATFATTGSNVYHTPKDDLSTLDLKGMTRLTTYILNYVSAMLLK